MNHLNALFFHTESSTQRGCHVCVNRFGHIFLCIYIIHDTFLKLNFPLPQLVHLFFCFIHVTHPSLCQILFLLLLPFSQHFCCHFSCCLSSCQFLCCLFLPPLLLLYAPDLLSLCLITKSTGSSRRSCHRCSPSVRSSLTRVRGTTWHGELVFVCLCGHVNNVKKIRHSLCHFYLLLTTQSLVDAEGWVEVQIVSSGTLYGWLTLEVNETLCGVFNCVQTHCKTTQWVR